MSETPTPELRVSPTIAIRSEVTQRLVDSSSKVREIVISDLTQKEVDRRL